MGEVRFRKQAEKEMRRLRRTDPKAAAALLQKIATYAADPAGDHAWARALTNRPGARLRQGDYRALLRLDKGPPVVISVMKIGHRKDVYL